MEASRLRRAGNLIELAVAFVVGLAFAAVVKAFTDVFVAILGKLGGKPNYNSYTPAAFPVGAFLTALVAFLITAAVISSRREAVRGGQVPLRQADEVDAAPDESVILLREIRDSLTARLSSTASTKAPDPARDPGAFVVPAGTSPPRTPRNPVSGIRRSTVQTAGNQWLPASRRPSGGDAARATRR